MMMMMMTTMMTTIRLATMATVKTTMTIMSAMTTTMRMAMTAAAKAVTDMAGDALAAGLGQVEAALAELSAASGDLEELGYRLGQIELAWLDLRAGKASKKSVELLSAITERTDLPPMVIARAWHILGLAEGKARRTAAAVDALIAPTVNCHRRRRKHTFSPTNISWGFEDRSALLRVKRATPESTHIENRGPSALSNPYLVGAALLSAGLAGIEQGLQPQPPSGDAPAEEDASLEPLPLKVR